MIKLNQLLIAGVLSAFVSSTAFAFGPAKPVACPSQGDFRNGAAQFDSVMDDTDFSFVFTSETVNSHRKYWQLVDVIPTGLSDADAITAAQASGLLAVGPAERDEALDFDSGEHFVVCLYHDPSITTGYDRTLIAFTNMSTNLSKPNAIEMQKNHAFMKTWLGHHK